MSRASVRGERTLELVETGPADEVCRFHHAEYGGIHVVAETGVLRFQINEGYTDFGRHHDSFCCVASCCAASCCRKYSTERARPSASEIFGSQPSRVRARV